MIPSSCVRTQWRSLINHLPRATLPAITTTPVRSLHATSLTFQKSMPPRPKPPPDSEIEESYLKGSGPGGQKINKTNSAVQLKHLPTGIVVKSQATRSRSQNRKIARESLAQKVDDFYNGDQSRSAIVGDIKKKRSDSAAKKKRRKYKKLELERSAAEQDEDVLEDEMRQDEEDGSSNPQDAADKSQDMPAEQTPDRSLGTPDSSKAGGSEHGSGSDSNRTASS